MDYEQALKDGRLADALAGVEKIIRAQPAEVKHRIFLFQLLSVMSEWQRAGKQLDVIRKLDDSALAMVHMYQTAISCELFREAVFRGEHDPVFMGDPEEWQALLLQSFKLAASERHTESEQVRERAFEMAPMSTGQLDGEGFSWIADADPRLGPVLEMIVEGRYMWVSFSHIAELTVEEPTDLRDIVWLPSHVRWHNGGESYALIFARYPGSERKDELALGRLTEWDSLSDNFYTGFGQKQLSTDLNDYSLFDIRKIKFLTAVDD